MATIVTKNSSTASAVPTTSDLVQGELAVNVTDKRIFTENASTQIVELGTNPSSITTATATVTGTLTANGTFASSNAVITGGSVNSTPIGATTPSTIVGSTVTANTGFVGGLTGNVTGNLTGNVTGNVNGNLTGNVTGNVTASSGTTTLNDLVVNGTADFTNTKLTNITTPTVGTDAANKSYVDDTVAAVIDSAPAALDTLNELAAALGDDANFAGTVTTALATKLPLAGGTMTGAIAMGTSKITGLGNPTSAQDAATKTYVDTADALKLNLTGGTMSGAIAMGTNKITGVGNPTLAQDAATKDYVDDILGSATSAATSAAAASRQPNAATSASNAASSATASANSAAAAAASYDAFDDRYLGDKASDPTLDNDGNALLTGALYFNTTSDVMKVYDGSAWNIAAISSASPTFTGTVTADGLTVDGDATLSSSGSVTLTLAADTDNITETDVPTIIMSQDNNLTNVYFGIEGIADTAFSGSVANYPYIKSTSALQIATSSSPTALFDYNGDISFYEDTGTTPKFFWDASAESLGVGTVSPVSTLHLEGADNVVARIRSTGADSLARLILQNDARTWTIDNDGANGDALTFYDATSLAERMRITSSGNVGIGVVPSAWSSTFKVLQLANGTSLSNNGQTSYYQLGANNYFDGTNYRYLASNFAAIHRFSNLGAYEWLTASSGTAGNAISFTQAMTLDSSGNLLVGKTVQGIATSGVELTPNDRAAFTKSGGAPILVNRTSNDGEIINLRKDGTTVGSIGIESNGFYIDGESAHAGIKFTGNAVIPRDNGVDVDGLNDIGASAGRWKDLYLSGGVYLGGTGAANKLDDYEEGTWTPAFTNLTIGNGTQSHIYTKVGNKVTLEGTITLGSTSSISGALNDASVPFTANTTQRAFNKCYFLDNGTANYVGTAVVNDVNVLQLLADNAASTYLTFSNLSSTVPFTWTSTDIIRYSITYITT
jgi:hypothetical protein